MFVPASCHECESASSTKRQSAFASRMCSTVSESVLEAAASWRASTRHSASAAIDLSTVSDASDENEALGIVDGVHDSVVPNSQAVVVSAGKLDGAHRSRIRGEPVDRCADSVSERTLQPTVLAGRRRVNTDLVLGLKCVSYSRTSAHGTAASRSSRACRAARLSSRYSRRSRRSA